MLYLILLVIIIVVATTLKIIFKEVEVIGYIIGITSVIFFCSIVALGFDDNYKDLKEDKYLIEIFYDKPIETGEDFAIIYDKAVSYNNEIIQAKEQLSNIWISVYASIRVSELESIDIDRILFKNKVIIIEEK